MGIEKDENDVLKFGFRVLNALLKSQRILKRRKILDFII